MSIFRIILSIVLLFITSCGDLTEQQANRQVIEEGLKDRQVQRVTIDQVISAGYNQGTNLVKQLEKRSTDMAYWQTPDGLSVLDSLNLAMGHNGFSFITTNEHPDKLDAEETALLEAYQYSSAQGQLLRDNVQYVPGQYLLYTSPLIKTGEFVGMWSIRLSRKTLIRNL